MGVILTTEELAEEVRKLIEQIRRLLQGETANDHI
jgi:hypothetical protein